VSVRTKRFWVGAAYYGALVVLCYAAIAIGEITGAHIVSALAILILLGHVLAFRVNPLIRLIQESVIREAECPACGEVIPLVQTWSCSCGFVTWQPRHAFSPCPNADCGKTVGWIDCPNCLASVTI
jgi:hypothetical protein